MIKNSAKLSKMLNKNPLLEHQKQRLELAIEQMSTPVFSTKTSSVLLDEVFSLKPAKFPFKCHLYEIVSIKFYKPHSVGAPFQRSGIKIDELVKPTLVSVTAGRGELLEWVIELIRKVD